MAAPPSYNDSIPGLRPDDRSLEGIVPPGETILRITRPTNPEDAGKAIGRQCLPLLALPCFWPHVIIGAPCWIPALCQSRYVATQAAKSQLVILTDKAIYSSTEDFDSCFCPGCHGCQTSGAMTKSVPLSRVTNVNVRTPGGGCCNQCMVDMERLEVETAGTDRAELVIIGAEDAEEFKLAVLDARSKDTAASNTVTIVQQPAAAGSQATGETKRLKVRLNRSPDAVKLVMVDADATMASVHAAICEKFDLPESKIRLFLTEDKIEIESVDELSNNDAITVCIGAETLN